EITSPGTYQLEVTNTLNGCQSVESIAISLNNDYPEIVIAAPPSLTCLDDQVRLDASASSQGVDFDFFWTTSDGLLLADTQSLTPLVGAAGTYTLTIINTSNGCQVTTATEVIEDRMAPVVDAGQLSEKLDCNTPILQLQGSASANGEAMNYQWSSRDGQLIEGADQLQAWVNEPGTYQLLVTNLSNGCVAMDEVVVEKNEDVPYDANVLVEAPLCFGDDGRFVVNDVLGGAGPYLFSLDEGLNYTTDSIYLMTPGNYTLHIQDINGCDYEHQVFVPRVPELQVGLEPNLEIRLGEQHQLIATVNVPDFQIDRIIWNPAITLSCTDCLDPVAAPVDPTTYELTVVTQNGCVDSAQVTIEVRKDRDIYIPNAFSPNDDGQNELFMIFANNLGIAQVNQFQVFSRWGELVFSANGFLPNQRDFGWDGRFRGEALNNGVFVYFAEIEFIDGVKKMYKGDVVLMR
ncbi:MAG: gliding motility-associated C-terminal domain-containing protein, partial [Bacteroidota bacterium]